MDQLVSLDKYIMTVTAIKLFYSFIENYSTYLTFSTNNLKVTTPGMLLLSGEKSYIIVWDAGTYQSPILTFSAILGR